MPKNNIMQIDIYFKHLTEIRRKREIRRIATIISKAGDLLHFNSNGFVYEYLKIQKTASVIVLKFFIKKLNSSELKLSMFLVNFIET